MLKRGGTWAMRWFDAAPYAVLAVAFALLALTGLGIVDLIRLI